MFRFAAKQTAVRMRELDRQIKRCRRTQHEEPIHDLRVATRRLQSCLKTFGKLFPARPVRKTLQRLRRMRALAGTVRDYDIAIALAIESSDRKGALSIICALGEARRPMRSRRGSSRGPSPEVLSVGGPTCGWRESRRRKSSQRAAGMRGAPRL